jgi:hypothetical protein
MVYVSLIVVDSREHFIIGQDHRVHLCRVRLAPHIGFRGGATGGDVFVASLLQGLLLTSGYCPEQSVNGLLRHEVTDVSLPSGVGESLAAASSLLLMLSGSANAFNQDLNCAGDEDPRQHFVRHSPSLPSEWAMR